MTDDLSLKELQLTSEQVYDGGLLKVFRDDIQMPHGVKAYREYIKHLGAVCVVPITDDGKVVIEHQWRYPMGKALLEIPAGKLDSVDEDHEEAARRELREETGAVATEMIYLGELYPTPAYSTEVIYMYLAKGLTFGERSLDEDECLTVETVPLKDLVKAILNGEIPDGKTQAAILRAAAYLAK